MQIECNDTGKEMFEWALNVFWYEEDNLFSGKRFTLIHDAMTVSSYKYK